MKGQKATVLRLLRERGSRGISAHDLVYVHGITRGAAVIYELKKAGVEIETIDEGDGKLATYILKDAVRPAPKKCVCGHSESGHVSGFQCMAWIDEVGYCQCQKFDAAG